jgi:hypothetical protein
MKVMRVHEPSTLLLYGILSGISTRFLPANLRFDGSLKYSPQ